MLLSQNELQALDNEQLAVDAQMSQAGPMTWNYDDTYFIRFGRYIHVQATDEITKLEHSLALQNGSQTSQVSVIDVLIDTLNTNAQEDLLRALRSEVEAETVEADLAEQEVLAIESSIA